MSYQDYIATPAYSGDEILEDWRWLVGSKAKLWLVTKGGDAILRDPSDGSIHWLDVLAGKLERIAADEVAFEKGVLSPENADRWLMREIVDASVNAGVKLGANECLSPNVPPVLGGKIEVTNFKPGNMAVHFSIAGQIHFQVKDLPPGTRISGVRLQEP